MEERKAVAELTEALQAYDRRQGQSQAVLEKVFTGTSQRHAGVCSPVPRPAVVLPSFTPRRYH